MTPFDHIGQLDQPVLPDLNLPPGLQAAHYGGQSIVNVASSVCQLLGAPPIASPPLRSELLAPLGGRAKRVVFLLLDALAYHRLVHWIDAGKLPVFEQLAKQGTLSALTSITPSTTSAAITTFWTGLAAAQHGITGYETWLREYGVIANMISHKPITYASGPGHLSAAGFKPDEFLNARGMGTHLKEAGIPTHAFQHFSILNSGLSDMFMADVDRHAFSTPVDLWVSVRELLENQPGESMYVWAYFGDYDGLSHFHGPDSERAAGEAVHFSAALHDHLIQPLSAKAARDTVFILAADHGQIATRKGDPHYQLVNHPNLTRRLRMITGENRLAYMYVKPGQVEAVREYVEKTWPNQFHILDSGYAIHHGLFGPGEAHPELGERTGDLILIARGDAFLWWHPHKADPLIGRHGGLHPEEMRVPFLAARLG
jgi:predicted AlkP superfamily pyrophosphatase or phosphodiesterase